MGIRRLTTDQFPSPLAGESGIPHTVLHVLDTDRGHALVFGVGCRVMRQFRRTAGVGESPKIAGLKPGSYGRKLAREVGIAGDFLGHGSEGAVARIYHRLGGQPGEFL